MPKSKRNQVVHLTKVKKKGKDHKVNLMDILEGYISKYKYAYLFNINHQKGQVMYALRLALKETGHVWAGANSMTVASLRNIGAKSKINYGDLARHVRNRRGLYFTDLNPQEFWDILDENVMEHWFDRIVGYTELKPSEEDKEVVSENEDDDDNDNDEQAEGFDGDETVEWKRVKFIPIKRVKIIKPRR